MSVSIHAARAGGDDATLDRLSLMFQSTPPARAATRRDALNPAVSIHAARAGGDDAHVDVRMQRRFNPRRPRGRRRRPAPRSAASMRVSIHAARAGGDAVYALPSRAITEFQSTPPARAAT